MLLKDFYTIVSATEEDSTFVTRLKINKEHPVYDGHFPQRPVTPGVILMQLFKEEVERRLQQKLRLKSVANVKFTAVVNPNETPELTLRSEIQENSDEIKLKGIAETIDGTALKINAVYLYKK